MGGVDKMAAGAVGGGGNKMAAGRLASGRSKLVAGGVAAVEERWQQVVGQDGSRWSGRWWGRDGRTWSGGC